jgi:ABC-2 type transport system permease protein
MSGYSFARARAVFLKELVQMRRDRMTFSIMLIMPVIQLLLFGYAINTDPRHLPTVIEAHDSGPLTRSFVAAVQASSFFDVTTTTDQRGEGERQIRAGDASFVIVIPDGFESSFVRGERPQILVIADASDPVATAGPLGAIATVANQTFANETAGALGHLAQGPPAYDIVLHRQFNPEGVTAFNIVPGLLGVILTMTMVMITSIALTREVERGTMESLLSTPIEAGEIMLGKTAPYILVGAIQTALVLIAARILFQVPFTGSGFALIVGVSLFIITNLMLGYLISTVARTQMQAMQMTFFIFLPSILLSGFMFPFRAMPAWAQTIGEALPLTHFLRIVRTIMLKSGEVSDIARDLGVLGIILAVLTSAALLRFRRTLD